MRKTLSVAAILAVAALSATACSKKNDNAAYNDNTTADTSAAMPAGNALNHIRHLFGARLLPSRRAWS